MATLTDSARISDVEDGLYITAGALGGTCAVLLIGLLFVIFAYFDLRRRVDDLQRTQSLSAPIMSSGASAYGGNNNQDATGPMRAGVQHQESPYGGGAKPHMHHYQHQPLAPENLVQRELKQKQQRPRDPDWDVDVPPPGFNANRHAYAEDANNARHTGLMNRPGNPAGGNPGSHFMSNAQKVGY